MTIPWQGLGSTGQLSYVAGKLDAAVTSGLIVTHVGNTLTIEQADGSGGKVDFTKVTHKRVEDERYLHRAFSIRKCIIKRSNCRSTAAQNIVPGETWSIVVNGKQYDYIVDSTERLESEVE